MSLPLIYEDDAILLSLPGSAIGGIVWDVHPTIGSPMFQVQAQIIVTPAPSIFSVFKLPDLYNYYPEIVRFLDRTYVNRDDVPLYFWDSVPRWDAEPFTWDEVIGPEPILKTTTRVMQLELEKSAQEISDLLTIYNLSRAQAEILPYHAAFMGTPLPAAKEVEQRAFLRELGNTYRKKGTPLSFFRLFESLGFNLILEETYQKKKDGSTVTGPQIDLVSTNHVTDESVDITASGESTYHFQLKKAPACRGGVTLKIFSDSANVPQIVTDDGDGAWTQGYGGSIDYATGTCVLILPSPPTLAGQPIEASYYYLVDPFPDPRQIKWTDRWRSSVVNFGLIPKDSTVNLTDEINDRLLLYLNLLKPAHVIIEALVVIFQFDENEHANLSDLLDLYAYVHSESLFGTLYLGGAWAARDNGSLNPHPPYIGTQGRTGPEFLVEWEAPIAEAILSDMPPTPDHVGSFWIDTSSAPATYTLKMWSGHVWTVVKEDLPDPTRYPNLPPYTYPFTLNGLATQPAAGNNFEADWFDNPASFRFSSLVTADVPVPTTSHFSIDKGLGTTLGVGDHILFEDGPAGGEASLISIFTDAGSYYDVTVSPAFDVAPEIGDTAVLINIDSVNMRNLQTGYRPQDPLDLYFGFVCTPAPNGITVGPFTTTITKNPILGGSTSSLRFTILGTNYEETATATGPFTNVSGLIAASNINYTTGAVTVTFTTAPDNGSVVETFSTVANAVDLGDY